MMRSLEDNSMISPCPSQYKKNRFSIFQKPFKNETIIEDGNGEQIGTSKKQFFRLKKRAVVYNDKNMTNDVFSIDMKKFLGGSFEVIDPLLGQSMGQINIEYSNSYYWKIISAKDVPYCLIQWDPKASTIFSSSGSVRKIHFGGKLIGKIYHKLRLSGYKSEIEIYKDPDFEVDRRLLIASVLCMQ